MMTKSVSNFSHRIFAPTYVSLYTLLRGKTEGNLVVSKFETIHAENPY